MHRADIHLVRRDLQALIHKAARNARQKLLCRFLRKGRDEDRLRQHIALADQVHHALDNRHSLARARPGNDQKRTVNMVDDLQLLWIYLLHACHLYLRD